MIEATRSATAMALAVAAALFVALGKVLMAVAFAVLSGPARVGTAHDLSTAGAWLAAVGGAVAVVALGWAAWAMVLRRSATDAVELGAAAAATLLVAVGLLVAAATSPTGSEAANVVGAIGFGAWAILLVTRAARRSLLEEAQPGLPHQAALWLCAGVGLVLVAVAVGLPDASVADKGLAVATAVLWALGLAALTAAIELARRKGFLVTRRWRELVAGLAILVASYVIATVVAAAVFGPTASLTAVRIGVPLAAAVAAAGLVVLALAAWNRLRELTVPAAATPVSEAPPPPAAVAAAGPPS